MAEDMYIYPAEARMSIESLTASDIRDVGSPKWFRQHEVIYKLSLQATMSVRAKSKEFVKDFILSSHKEKVLIHELLLAELWKEEVFPKIISPTFQPRSIVPLYSVLYHETALLSLLGTILFHNEVVKSADDLLLDIVDYCQRTTIHLLKCTEGISDEPSDATNLHKNVCELLEKKRTLDFFIAMESISVLSSIVENPKALPLCVMHRLFNVHNFPVILVHLILYEPWRRISEKGIVQLYSDGKWVYASDQDAQKMTKVEGQVWISLSQLLTNSSFMGRYEFNDYRKRELLKLRPKITDCMKNQLPLLEDFQVYLEQLAGFDPPRFEPYVLIVQYPEIREGLLNKHKGKWLSIANDQVSEYFSSDSPQSKSVYKGLANIYTMDSFEAMLLNKPPCASCYKEGPRRCSRCENEWYCGRKCQVNHWLKHKPICDLLKKGKF